MGLPMYPATEQELMIEDPRFMCGRANLKNHGVSHEGNKAEGNFVLIAL